MKYFANIHTPEELKKQYRVYCQTMHPDKGGSADDFAQMLNEYEQAARMMGKQSASDRRRAQEAEEAAREAAERRAQWQREEAERKAREEAERAKARPAYEARCKKWAHLMHEVPPITAAWSDPERKAQERKAHSTRRANILAMCRAAFPGVKFSLTYANGWGSHFTVEWQDGPTPDELKAATDFDLFVSGWDTFDGMTDCAGYANAMFNDFAKKYNGLSGQIKVNRVVSVATFERVRDLVARLAEYDGNETKTVTFKQRTAIYEALNIQKPDECDRRARNHYDALRNIGGGDFARLSLHNFASVLCDYLPAIAPESDAKKAPEFKPKHNDIYKKIARTMSAHALGKMTRRDARGRWTHDGSEILDLYTLIDFAPDCGLFIGRVCTYRSGAEITSHWYSFYSSSAANDRKRVQNYAEIGITIKADGEILAVSPDVIAALREDRANVEQQRKAWEEAQNAPKAKKQRTTTETPTTEATTGDVLAEADGVTLTATDKGATLTGETYAHRDEIKANGARWYRLGKCWTISADKIPAFMAMLQNWGNTTTDTTTDTDATTSDNAPTASDNTTEAPTTEAPTTDTTTEEPDEISEAAARVAVSFVEWCKTLQEIATAAREDIERNARKQEADQLRADIATMRDNIAAMGEQLRQMAERLAELTEATTEAEAPQGATATEEHDTARATSSESDAPTITDQEREKVRQTFDRAAREYDEATDRNDHTAAIYAQGLALRDVLTDETDRATASALLRVLQEIACNHYGRGHILPEEVRTRSQVADTLARLAVSTYGAELAALLFGAYTVRQIIGGEQTQKAA